jgi:hypothetical protein
MLLFWLLLWSVQIAFLSLSNTTFVCKDSNGWYWHRGWGSNHRGWCWHNVIMDRGLQRLKTSPLDGIDTTSQWDAAWQVPVGLG